MKIEKVKKTDTYCLHVTFDDGKEGDFDISDKIRGWFRDGKKELIKISENFASAHVDSGNLAFNCGKDVLYIGAKDVRAQTSIATTQTKAKKQENKPATKTTYIKRKNIGLGTINSLDVLQTVADGLPFTGVWKEFLGEPAKNFYMILSAQPGHGKSTFCLKFGNYLSKFGRVLYITNEEDAARIKGKLSFIKDKINDFDISFNTKTVDDVVSLISQGKYDFVFIDSAQYGGMDYKELRQIRETFPDIAIIAICRQTKTGSSRGSQEKEYDGDITVKFDEPGHAITVKNRFWELSQFQLF